jgi:hypothetical protein
LEIRAWIDPAEGPAAPRLASERARKVQAHLVSAGFSKGQVPIALHPVPRGATVNDIRITVHDRLPE